MALRAEPKERRAAVRMSVKLALRQNKADADTGLRTGSAAPSELSARPLEASIGLEVRRLRKSIDLTLTELGVAAGISAGMMSKIEHGSISPSLGTLNALAKALNVPITRLFAGTDERQDCSSHRAPGYQSRTPL
jgi:DNA-binding XRE family transcriptional regulator